MSRLSELLRQVRKTDPQLGADLAAEIDALTKRRTFGLVFERHQPEAVELPGRRVRAGDKVRVLPPRGETKAGDQRLWRVVKTTGTGEGRIAHLAELDAEEPETLKAPIDDLVVVAQFRDRIYPGLIETGRVERGGDKPFHTVINGENFHALEMLTYTHRHSIDAIYIDPPYNTGAKDWKYNNDYVAPDDDYRHSKWLAFMERRLKVARELLNPDNSVLIVTIDEKEYLRLGLLLEQTFPESRSDDGEGTLMTMVTSSISSAGVTRGRTFGRSAEYIFIVQLGHSSVGPLMLPTDWNPVRTDNKAKLRWNLLLRSGTNTSRAVSKIRFYPVYVKNSDAGPVLHSIGHPYEGDDYRMLEPPEGTEAVWPIRSDGSDGVWQVSRETLAGLFSEGFVQLGKWRGGDTTIYYLKTGEANKVRTGVFPVVGHRADGSVIVDAVDYQPSFVPTDVWRIPSHDAGNHGSRLVASFLPRRRFPFPKSLYAVEDALRFFVKDKPDAAILDFFAGSGTTAHAVMRLNRQDSGRRQCISITNNEVSADEEKRLRKAELRPGDAEWEALGICDHITKPRVTAAITGLSPDGDPIKGDYKFTDEFPMSEGFEENAAFFTLTYEGPLSVRHSRAFARIAPMLWLRAGSRGRIINDLGDEGWDVADAYGVLENLDQAADFTARIREQSGVEMAFIVTDDASAFQMVCRELPETVTPVQLYESYLQNFEIDTGWGA